MADTTVPSQSPKWRIDKAWAALIVILALVAVLDWAQFWPTITFAAGALWHTAPVHHLRRAGGRLYEGQRGRDPAGQGIRGTAGQDDRAGGTSGRVVALLLPAR